MKAAKRNSPPGKVATFFSALGLLASGPARRLALLVLLVGGVGSGSYYAWDRWGQQIARSPEYFLNPEHIHITPKPDWVQGDVTAEVVRDGGLAGLSILDKQLTVKVAQAFAKHRWVEEVTRVSKHHPAQVVVELVYRRPVAMVEVTLNDQPGLLPIDVNGALLPPHDFQPDQTRQYLRVSAPQAAPAGPVGTPWGDPRVHGAARIAAILLDHWRKLGLHRIVPSTPAADMAQTDQITYDLLTRGGSRIIWGKAPDPQNAADLAAARKKISKLLTYIETSGPLDSAKGPVELDISQAKRSEPPEAQTLPASTPVNK